MARTRAWRSFRGDSVVPLLIVAGLGVVIAGVSEWVQFFLLALVCGALLAGGLVLWRRRTSAR